MRDGRDANERSNKVLGFISGAISKGKQMLAGGGISGSKKLQSRPLDLNLYSLIKTPDGEVHTSKKDPEDIIYTPFKEPPIVPEAITEKVVSAEEKNEKISKGTDYVQPAVKSAEASISKAIPTRVRKSSVDGLIRTNNTFTSINPNDIKIRAGTNPNPEWAIGIRGVEDNGGTGAAHGRGNEGIPKDAPKTGSDGLKATEPDSIGAPQKDALISNPGSVAVDVPEKPPIEEEKPISGPGMVPEGAGEVQNPGSVAVDVPEKPTIEKGKPISGPVAVDVPEKPDAEEDEVIYVGPGLVPKGAGAIPKSSAKAASAKAVDVPDMPAAEDKGGEIRAGIPMTGSVGAKPAESESIWKRLVVPKLRTVFLPPSAGALMLSAPTSDCVSVPVSVPVEAHSERVIKLGPAGVMYATPSTIIIEPRAEPVPIIKEEPVQNAAIAGTVKPISKEVAAGDDIKPKESKINDGTKKDDGEIIRPPTLTVIKGNAPKLKKTGVPEPIKSKKSDVIKGIKESTFDPNSVETIKLTPPKKRRARRVGGSAPKSIAELEKEHLKSITETKAKPAAEEKAPETLNKIMLESRENAELEKKCAEAIEDAPAEIPKTDVVIPSIPVAKLPPIQVEDEVADIMRFVVPDLDFEDRVEEDSCWDFEDGIEETLFAVPKKSKSGVVFSFGGVEGEGCVRFSFGCM